MCIRDRVLAIIMHQGGGQETFEDPGTEIWVFSTVSQRRGYRLAMEDGRMVSSVQITQDEDPLMLLSVGGERLKCVNPSPED